MAARRHILVLDDDVEVSRLLAEAIEADGEFAVTTAQSIAEAEVTCAARDTTFAALILDVGLPDGDGRHFCSVLRQRGMQMPILMLTGFGGVDDMVQGLDAGANDYIAKPFRLPVLLARLRSQCREFESSMHLAIRVGPYSFRPSEKVLRDAGRRRIRLTDKETKILRRLCRTPGRGVAREVLLSEVWGHSSPVSTHTLETHIYRLRQKIEANPSRPAMILCADGCYSVHPETATA